MSASDNTSPNVTDVRWWKHPTLGPATNLAQAVASTFAALAAIAAIIISTLSIIMANAARDEIKTETMRSQRADAYAEFIAAALSGRMVDGRDSRTEANLMIAAFGSSDATEAALRVMSAGVDGENYLEQVMPPLEGFVAVACREATIEPAGHCQRSGDTVDGDT